jgi:hypothetical protein
MLFNISKTTKVLGNLSIFQIANILHFTAQGFFMGFWANKSGVIWVVLNHRI